MAVRRSRVELALVLGALLLGCGCEPAAEPTAASAGPSERGEGAATADPPAQERQPAARVEEAPDPGASPSSEGASPPVAASPADVDPPAPSVDALAQAVAGAAEAAAGAPAEGGSTCEQAYASVIAMVRALQQQLGGGPGGLPDRESFVAACNELPENVQRCMVMAYAAQHREECQRATASVDGATRERIRRMMGAGAP